MDSFICLINLMWDGCLGGCILHDYSYSDAFENNLLHSNNHYGLGNCWNIIKIINEKKKKSNKWIQKYSAGFSAYIAFLLMSAYHLLALMSIQTHKLLFFLYIKAHGSWHIMTVHTVHSCQAPNGKKKHPIHRMKAAHTAWNDRRVNKGKTFILRWTIPLNNFRFPHRP